MQLAVLGDTYQDFELPIKNRSHLACSIRHLASKKKKKKLQGFPLPSASHWEQAELSHTGRRSGLQALCWLEGGLEGGTSVLEGELQPLQTLP